MTGQPRAPLPSCSDTTPPQDRGDKGASSGNARERSDGRLYPPTAVFLPRRNASRWKRFLRAGRSSRHLRSFPFQRNKNPRAEKPFEALAHKRLSADGKSARREVPLHDANAGGQTAPAANAQPALILARMVGLDPRAKLPSAGRYVHIGWQEFLPRCHRLRQVEVVPMRATRHRVAPGRPVSQ